MGILSNNQGCFLVSGDINWLASAAHSSDKPECQTTIQNTGLDTALFHCKKPGAAAKRDSLVYLAHRSLLPPALPPSVRLNRWVLHFLLSLLTVPFPLSPSGTSNTGIWRVSKVCFVV